MSRTEPVVTLELAPRTAMAHRSGPLGRIGVARALVSAGRRSMARFDRGARRSVLLSVGALLLVGMSAVPAILGAGSGQASALDSFPSAPRASAAVVSGASAPLASPTAAAPSAPSASAASLSAAASPAAVLPDVAGLVGGPDPVDLATKGVLVGALLYLTLRVLRHLQSGPTSRGSRLTVLETRTLASKASLHLVGVGERRIVVGLTPAGMVALAELDATELPEPIADRAIDDARPAPSTSRLAGARSIALDSLRGLLP